LGTSSSRFLPSVARLIENLDRAGVKTPGSRSVEILAGASFDDDDVDLRPRQLSPQHHPGGTASGDHHCSVNPGIVDEFLDQRGFYAAARTHQ
jgi:hypothetical protein